VDRPLQQSGGAAKLGVITAKVVITAKWGENGKNEGDKGASSISRLLGAAKLQSTLSADNPRYVAAIAKLPHFCSSILKRQ